MSIFEWVAAFWLAILLLAIFCPLLFPPGVGEHDGRCGEDMKVSKARASAIRSAWFDA